MKTSTNKMLDVATFVREPIGPCGGMVTGQCQSKAGDWLWVRCDVFGGAVRGPSDNGVWRPIVTALTIPSGELSADLNIIPMNGSTPYADRPGIPALACAPSNGAIAVMQWCGKVYRTLDGLATPWVRMTGVPQLSLNCNGNDDRMWGPRIAIHPTNPDIAIMGTQTTTLYYTTNLTATTPNWTAITVPAAILGPGGKNHVQHLVAFNPANPAEVFFSVAGTAIYKSTTGVTGTFSQFATSLGGVAPNPQKMKFHDNGTLYVTQYGQADNLYKLVSGGSSFSRVTLGGKQALDIALDWTNANHLVAILFSTIMESTDGGATWPHLWDGQVSNVPPQQLVRASIGKALDAGVNREWSPACNDVQFDRAVPGQLINVCGVGFLKTTLPTWVSATASPIIWVEDLLGDIPMLVTQCGVFAGDGTFIAGCHDEGMFAVIDQNRYVNVRDQPPGPADAPHLIEPVNVQPCTDLRIASDDPSYVVAFKHGGTWASAVGTTGPINDPHFGYNDNYGRPGHWHAWPTQPNNKPYTFGGGFMLQGPKGHTAHIYNADGVPEGTEDGGHTWFNLNIPGLAAQLSGGGHGIEFQGNGFWLNRRVGDYDATAGKYRLFIYGGIIGFYEATNLSDEWVRVSTDAPISQTVSSGHVWHCHFLHVPGVANKAYWTNGLGTPGVNNFENDAFMVTTDGCRTWKAIKPSNGYSWGSVTGVVTFDFSAPAYPGAPPCMMFFGWVKGTINNTFGYFRTDDDFATEPVLLANYPMNWIDSPMRIVGNRNKYHDFRICYSGSGVIRVAPSFQLKLAA